MNALKPSEDLRPVSDLKSHGADIVRQVGESGRPVVLTRHGRGVAVVMSVSDYEQVLERLRRVELQRAIEEGEADIAAGRVVSNGEVKRKLRRWASEKT